MFFCFLSFLAFLSLTSLFLLNAAKVPKGCKKHKKSKKCLKKLKRHDNKAGKLLIWPMRDLPADEDIFNYKSYELCSETSTFNFILSKSSDASVSVWQCSELFSRFLQWNEKPELEHYLNNPWMDCKEGFWYFKYWAKSLYVWICKWGFWNWSQP